MDKQMTRRVEVGPSCKCGLVRLTSPQANGLECRSHTADFGKQTQLPVIVDSYRLGMREMHNTP